MAKSDARKAVRVKQNRNVADFTTNNRENCKMLNNSAELRRTAELGYISAALKERIKHEGSARDALLIQ